MKIAGFMQKKERRQVDTFYILKMKKRYLRKLKLKKIKIKLNGMACTALIEENKCPLRYI